MSKLLLIISFLLCSNIWAYSNTEILTYLLINPDVKILLEEGDLESVSIEKENHGTTWDYIVKFKTLSRGGSGVTTCEQIFSLSQIGGVAGNFLSEPVIEASNCRIVPNHLNPDHFINPQVCGMGGPLMINDQTGECIQSLSTCTTNNLRKSGFRAVRLNENVCHKSNL